MAVLSMNFHRETPAYRTPLAAMHRRLIYLPPAADSFYARGARSFRLFVCFAVCFLFAHRDITGTPPPAHFTGQQIYIPSQPMPLLIPLPINVTAAYVKKIALMPPNVSALLAATQY